MNQYQVVISVGGPLGSEDYDVDADGHRIERPQVDGAPPFIIFYRDLPLVLDPVAPEHAPDPDNAAKCICGHEVDGFTAPELVADKLAGHIAAGNETLVSMGQQMDGQEILFAADPHGGPVPEPVHATATLEVFRAPLHALLAVRLVDDDDEDDE